MGRITAYDQDGRMVADFDKSGYDLMWMRQGYDDEIERLMAENATLRQQLADVTESMGRVEEMCAKLRELARGLGQCAQGVNCEDCLLYDLSEPDHCREERLSRELGIEVDD